MSLSTRKSMALLVYLACQPERRASRERLAALFWEDAHAGQARLNLRKALSALRQETRLPGRPDRVLLDANNDAVWLVPGALATDVETFEAALQGDLADASTAARIAELYNGDFLNDLSVRGAPAFEDWALLERQRLRELALTALSGLLDHALEPGFAPEIGVRAAMRMLALDPLQERAHRALMRLHVRQGRRGAALKQFHALSEQLARDLNTTPEAATRELFREISSSRHTGVPAARAAASAATQDDATAQDGPPPAALTEAMTPPPRRPRKRLVTTVAAACLALVAVSGAIAFFQPRLLPGLLAATEREKSVAVLPFANFSSEADTGLFADGLTEEVINSLAQYADLKVSGRTSAFYFKGKDADLREVGRKLGVAYVVEGSVRREGDRLRVTAQLIDVADGFHIWSATYDRQMSDAFAIQDELARTVAGELKARLEPPRRGAIQGDPEVYRLHLVAQAHLRNGGKDDLATARRLFQHLLELEPDNVRALAGYAEATISLGHKLGLPPDEARRSSEEAVARALKLDPNSAEAYAAKSRIYTVVGKWAGQASYQDLALEAARRAVELSPRDPDALSKYGRQLLMAARAEEGVSMLERAREIDPLDRDAQAHLAVGYRMLGRMDKAVQQSRNVVELFPDYEFARLVLGRILYEQGKVVEAERAFRQVIQISGNPRSRLDLAFLYANLHMADEANAELDRLESPQQVVLIRRTLKYHLARDFRSALAFAESEVARDPDSAMRGVVLVDAAVLGDYARARRQLESIAPKLLTEKPEVADSAIDPTAVVAAHVLNRTGEEAQARRILVRVLEATTRRPGQNPLPELWLARINAYAELGDKERALAELRQAIDAGFHDGLDAGNYMPLDAWPSLQPLRGDPRFKRMLDEIDARNRSLQADLLAARRKR
ncbi:BTAD domain-containing putative transcriptional regulator [Caulobacter sp. 17J65-9]|uniref:BTAD domain-containing putative transcriptional regulator n=1 Tax=Caulobacter sp. 17J65-9 TaxID=2709382 RepID=UPI0013D1AD7C